MNVVYVLSPDREPLMPCSCAIARLLLKDGKAKVVHRTPFTIKLYTQPEDAHMQPLTIGVDTGSATIGSAVSDECGNVLYLSEVEIRNDIAKTMKEQATSRRNRRNRKTRYRLLAGLPKEHVFDATMIATRGITPSFARARCSPSVVSLMVIISKRREFAVSSESIPARSEDFGSSTKCITKVTNILE